MKKINDVLLYKYFTIITLLVAVILGMISYYSIWGIEPEARRLIAQGAKIYLGDDFKSEEYEKAQNAMNTYFTQAYQMLKKPQLFARYENFDRSSIALKSILESIDTMVEEGANFEPVHKIHLTRLLERREQGSRLGRATMFFFLFLFFAGLCFYLWEHYSVKGGPNPKTEKNEVAV
jgi:hypothetical protein